MKAQLILENGMRFSGTMFGYEADIAGEVVFTTGMGGYQEALTDPSFAGQIVTMTFPLVGNYGINLEDNEADKANLKALVVREKCDYPSNFRNEMTLDDFLKSQRVVGIEGIDTRALTRVLRDCGIMRGAIMKGEPSDEDAKKLIAALDNSKVVKETSTKKVYTVNEEGKTNVAFLDLGTKNGIMRELVKRGCKLTVFPYDTKAEDIEAIKPDMVFVSNGPGDPADIPEVVETVRELIGKVPVYGICMGHLVIGLALGCKTTKLKFGHHGENHPVKDLSTGKVYITSQNHNYAVTDYTDDVEATFVNVNDGTCEGIRSKSLPVASVQFHPEAAPGPLEAGFLFDTLMKEVQ